MRAQATTGRLGPLAAAPARAASGGTTAGTGSTPHFVSGILETQYGAKLDIVPYKSGSESITAVIGKQVEATSEASIVALPYVKSGRLKALADTWTARMNAVTTEDIRSAFERKLQPGRMVTVVVGGKS